MSNVTILENGLYEVTYTATDESGNSSSVVRTVTVSSLASDPVDSTSSCGVEQPDAITACTQDATAPTVLNCPAEPGGNPLETVCIPCGSRIYGCTNRAALNYNIRATHDDGSCVFLQPPAFGYGGTSLLLPQCGSIFRFSPILTGGPVVRYEICNSTANPPLPPPPSWINLDPKTGQLFGVSPCGQGLDCDFEPFQIRVCAINNAGVGSVTITIDPFCPVVVPGCTNPKAVNFNPNANQNNGSCQIVGCRDPQAPNFDPEANIDGFCVKLGCTTPGALNYNPLANTDDGSCVFCQDPYVQIISIEWVEPYYSSGLPPWFTPDPDLDERCYQCYKPSSEQGHCGGSLTPCPGPSDWVGRGDLVISGLARNTTQVLVTINGITKTVLVSSTGNWVAIFSRAEVLQFPYGTLEVQAASSSFCAGGQPARDSRQFEKPEEINLFYVGVTASTGSLRSIQTIYDFKINGKPVPLDPRFRSGEATLVSPDVWRLTSNKYDSGGGIWAIAPTLTGKIKVSFSYTIGGDSEADGFALIFSSAPFLAGFGGGLGYQDGNPNSFAVEIDSYHNEFDPNNSHVALIWRGQVRAHLALATVPIRPGGNLEAEIDSGVLTVRFNGIVLFSYPIDLYKILNTPY